ncbi:hypothetical protein [Gluconobacter sp.]|uniref:hypothetical protein n=1 Tax=Gluconobacter sp. TaxID=1876758 RepID=UPI0039EB3A31
MRDDAVRMLSGPNQRGWLARNTRYEPETDRLLVWNIITWRWCLATTENILELCPLSVRGFGDPGDIWKDVRAKANSQLYDPQQRGDAPVHNQEKRREWLRESRRRKCLPERIEIFNIIQGRWVAVTQENLAEHYSRSYWEPIGLRKAWEEIEAGAVADPEAELTLQEHAEFLAEHLFGTRCKSPETSDERISVIVEDFYSAREEQERAPPPPPPPQQLPTFEERLDARMPGCPKCSKSGQPLRQAISLHGWWSKICFIINGHWLRSINGHLFTPCGRLDGPCGEMQKRGSGLKTLEENIALPREVFSGEGCLCRGASGMSAYRGR